jgi:predicted 3-demethylubiquinone-9 3-methyltransferase (glyoxalase superfamily)
MVRVTPQVWLDQCALDAATLYVSLLPGSSITRVCKSAAGAVTSVSFVVGGQPLIALNGGAVPPNPSISFTIRSASPDETRAIWEKLAGGATVLMELAEYPFSPCYGWLADKFGVSWQILTQPDASPRVAASLMFTREMCGRAAEAINFWGQILGDSSAGDLRTYPDSAALRTFRLAGTVFSALDSAPHEFAFNEAVSLAIEADTQEEVDFFWSSLSAVAEAERGGWLKDRYAVSWRIVPAAVGRMLETGSPAQVAEVTRELLAMKKPDIAGLQAVFDAVAEKE